MSVLDPTTHPQEWLETPCGLCVLEGAWHKVMEDEYLVGGPTRHPLTNYVCCRCFGRLMGVVARDWCEEFWVGARQWAIAEVANKHKTVLDALEAYDKESE